MNLTSPAAVRELLRRRGLRPSRRRGQNFLADGNLVRKVAEAADLRPADGVLEIGPGLGVLTRELAARARRVLAVEVDAGLCAALREETLAGLGNVALHEADFLAVDLESLVRAELGPGRHAVAANIPYSITTPVIVRLLEHPALFDRVVLLVQKEVADRMTAAPGTGDYGSLTLFCHLHADVRRVAAVPRQAFLPAPEVDSAIVRLNVLPAPRFPDLSPERYLAVVHAAFQQRRKSLSNALTGPALGWEREAARAALARAGLDPARRGETLTPAEFATLARVGPP